MARLPRFSYLTLFVEYAALANDGAVGSFVYESKEKRDETSIDGAHLVSLRQIGFELLNSPQLTCLCSG